MRRAYLMILLLITVVLAQEGAVDPDLFVGSDTPVKTPGYSERPVFFFGDQNTFPKGF
jgi:hypothetical protein